MTCGHYEILRLRGKRNEINPPTPAGISHIPQGSYFVEKNPLLSGRQKRVLTCERLPKRSRIEVRKPKSTPLFLIEIDVQMLLKTKPFHNIVINNII